ncbi:unnamed protein product [Citrullus colocynthis]|uniref:Uncharacterized protein n=1 Tax=Citrullus colocynthis TaxID=252529 RepID=A0ABP0Y813_9ROSI
MNRWAEESRFYSVISNLSSVVLSIGGWTIGEERRPFNSFVLSSSSVLHYFRRPRATARFSRSFVGVLSSRF